MPSGSKFPFQITMPTGQDPANYKFNTAYYLDQQACTHPHPATAATATAAAAAAATIVLRQSRRYDPWPQEWIADINRIAAA